MTGSEASGTESPSSSKAVIATLIASPRARAFARVSASLISADAIARVVFSGSASPRPVNVPRSVTTSAWQMATNPFCTPGACTNWVLIWRRPAW